MTEKKRIHVTFTQEQIDLLSPFKGELGSSIPEIVRNIVISWLAEKSFISSRVKIKYYEIQKNSEKGVDQNSQN